MTKTLSDNIRAEMARTGATQTQLAGALGLPQAAISRRLCDETPWRVSELQAIAAFLHVSIAALLPDGGQVMNSVAS